MRHRVFTCRTIADAEETQKAVQEEGRKALLIPGDVTIRNSAIMQSSKQ